MSFPTDSWKTQSRNAAKSVLILICNETNDTLVRTDYSLVSGIWSHFPPESIPPNTTVEFGSHASGFIAKSTEGVVQYKCELNPEYWLTFNWVNNVWGKKQFTANGPPNFSVNQTVTEANHSTVKYTVTKGTNANNNNTVSNNNNNRPTIDSVRSSPSDGRRNSSSSASSASNTPDDSPTTSVSNFNALGNSAAKSRREDKKGQNNLSPSGSSSDLGLTPTPTPQISSDWKDEIAKATRSVLITVENKTMHTLRRRDQVLKHGVWSIFPPESILPNDIVTFAARTDGWVAGTEGIIYYSIPGIKGDISFYWCNPYIGDRSFKSRAPPEIRIEHVAKKKNQATAIFYVIPNDEEEDQQKAQRRKYGEEPTVTTPDNFSVKLMTLNTQLLPPIISKNNTEKRARKIADLIIRRKYDIVCLQEVFYANARNILSEELKAEYPYQLIKSGGGLIVESSGLFVASKFPIIKHKFWQFDNAVGSDTLCSKGVLGIKFDLASVGQDKSLYVFVTHLQSNPDGSLPWKLSGVGYEGAIRIRENQFNFIITKIERTLESEARDGKNIKNMGIILCGDFQTTAENETKFVSQSNSNFNVSLRASQGIKVDEPKTIRKIDLKDTKNQIEVKSFQFYSEAVKTLANHINQQENKIIYSSDIIDNMNGNNIPIEYLGHFRALIKEHLTRERLLFLIEMITFVIKQEITARLKAIVTSSNNVNSNNEDEVQEALLDLNTYRDIVLSYYQQLLAQEKTESRHGSTSDFSESSNESNNVDNFWTNFLLEKLITTFSEGLNLEERRTDYPMQKFVFILKFQLLQSLRKATGVMLKSASVERILKEDSSIVAADDVFMIDTAEPNIALNNFNFTETVESNPDAPLDSNNVFEWRLRKTREYENMLEILSNPRDLFRERNPNFPGYTVNSFENMTEKNKGLKIRIDYILAFNKVGKLDLNHIKVKDCRVLPFGSTPQTQASGHYSVEALFSMYDGADTNDELTSNITTSNTNSFRNF